VAAVAPETTQLNQGSAGDEKSARASNDAIPSWPSNLREIQDSGSWMSKAEYFPTLPQLLVARYHREGSRNLRAL
jgi:hypothetical protein